MRATLVSYGSTGDVRPLVALAVALDAAGHDVVLVGDVGGRSLAEQNDLPFHALAGDLRAMMQPGGAVSSAMEAGRPTLASMRRFRYPDEAWLRTIGEAAEGSDLVLGMPIAGYHAIAGALAVGARPVLAVLQPLAPTREVAPVGFGVGPLPGAVPIASVGWRSGEPGAGLDRR